MASTLPPDVFQDDIAMSLARVIAVANRRAHELGVDAVQSLITITQHPFDSGLVWRINYGPKDYVGRRGGDLIIEIEPGDVTIKRVMWGQ